MRPMVYLACVSVATTTIAAADVCGAGGASSNSQTRISAVEVDSFVSDECTSTSVFVSATTTVFNDNSGGPPTSDTEGEFDFTFIDFCKGTTIKSPFALLPFDPRSFSIQGNSATLNTTLEVEVCTDSSPDCPLTPVTISVTLTGTGATSDSNSHQRIVDSSGDMENLRNKNTFQNASAAGTLTVDSSLVLTIDDVGDSFFETSNDGVVSITHP